VTALTTRVPAGHYRFRHAARMEWITATGAVGIGVAVGTNTRTAGGDLTNNALAGIIPSLLLIGVLGALAMTSEYSSGMIRTTLSAAPRRPLLLAAKAAVFGAVAVAVGEAASFIAFFAGGAALRHGIAAPALTQPGVLRAVLLAGVSFGLIGLIGLGLGAIVRHSGAAIAVVVGGVYVLPTIAGSVAHGVGVYMPIIIIGNSLTVTKPGACPAHAAACPHFLSVWAGLGLLGLYAAAALAAGGWLFARRDA
jgi:ABC-2 type transport system permease protein